MLTEATHELLAAGPALDPTPVAARFDPVAEGDSQGTVGILPIDFQMNQPLPDLFLVDLVGRLLAEVGQLPDRSQVAVNRPRRHSGQMQVIRMRW